MALDTDFGPRSLSGGSTYHIVLEPPQCSSFQACAYADIKGDSPCELQGSPRPQCGAAPGAAASFPVGVEESQLQQGVDHIQRLTYADGEASVSSFSALGRPHSFARYRPRVYECDIPLRWRSLRVKVQRGSPGISSEEQVAIINGGFWQPSVSAQDANLALDPGPQGLASLSKFMQAQIRVIQQEAEEVAHLLRASKQRLAYSISCSTGRLSRGTGRVLRRGWRMAKHIFCCCAAGSEDGTAASDTDDAVHGVRQPLLDSVDSDLQGQQGGGLQPAGSDSTIGLMSSGGSTDDAALHDIAERELQRRLSTRLSATVEAVLRWGRADPLRTPILTAPQPEAVFHADSAGEIHRHDNSNSNRS